MGFKFLFAVFIQDRKDSNKKINIMFDVLKFVK